MRDGHFFGDDQRVRRFCLLIRNGFTKLVDFESFSKVLNRPGGFRDPGEPEEYCRGFQVFDKDMTGFIGVGQLRYSECLDQYNTSYKPVNCVSRLFLPSPLVCCNVGVGTRF